MRQQWPKGDQGGGGWPEEQNEREEGARQFSMIESEQQQLVGQQKVDRDRAARVAIHLGVRGTMRQREGAAGNGICLGDVE